MKLASLLVVMVMSGAAHADHGPRQAPGSKAQLRALLLQHFDANGDGKLGPRERQRAARALHRLAIRLGQSAQQQAPQRQPRQGRRGKLIYRYDLNRDGNLGPGEMPPSIADELRPLDRDGDGWLRDGELP